MILRVIGFLLVLSPAWVPIGYSFYEYGLTETWDVLYIVLIIAGVFALFAGLVTFGGWLIKR